MNAAPVLGAILALAIGAAEATEPVLASPFALRIVKSVGPVSSPAVRAHVEFCRDLGFNAVWVYSGQAGLWAREAAPRGPFLFPEFRPFARWCAERNLRIVASINPVADSGGSLVFSERDGERRIRRFMRRLRGAGVRDFVLSYDDQPPELYELRDMLRYGRSAAPAHLDLAARLLRSIRRGERLWLCAATYADVHVGDGRMPYSRYVLDHLRLLSPRVGLVWTGPEVISRTITIEDIARVRGWFGDRPLLLYDNYPDGDDPGDALALILGPLRNRDPRLHEAVAAYLANPMTALGASRLPLLTIADYLRDPARYDPDASWAQALRRLAGNDREILDAVRTQAMEWGGWVGTLNYHPRDELNPASVAGALDNPAFVASWEWTVRRYPERMERIGRAEDAAFRQDVLDVMARRLAVGRAIPLVIELLARRRARRSDTEEILRLLARERDSMSAWPNAQRALDLFCEAAGVALPRGEAAAR